MYLYVVIGTEVCNHLYVPVYVNFLQLVEDNLKAFNSAIVGEVTLFQVETLLAVPDVVLHPAANEVYKLTLQCVRDCVEG